MATPEQLADPRAHIVEVDGVKYAVPTLYDYRRYREMARPDPERGWAVAFDDKKARIRVHTRMAQAGEPGAGLIMALVTAEYPDVPVESLWACLQDNDYRLVWDKNQMEGHLVATLDQRCVLWYYACKFPVVANRDFVSQSSSVEFTNGDRMTVSQAITHPSEPQKPPFVRGESVMTINYIERLDPKSEMGCKLSYLSHCDLKGSIPRFLLNRATASLLPGVMKSLGDTARKYAAYAEATHGPGYTPPWRTREMDWGATDDAIAAMRREEEEAKLAAAMGKKVGDAVTTLVADEDGHDAEAARALHAASAAGRLEAIVRDAMAFADAWFVEQRVVPTREAYLVFVRSAIRSTMARAPSR